MFCTSCGLEERQSNQFCRVCDIELRTIRALGAAKAQPNEFAAPKPN
jgi:NMD protein affecting ribosome stability and mRNA decay